MDVMELNDLDGSGCEDCSNPLDLELHPHDYDIDYDDNNHELESPSFTAAAPLFSTSTADPNLEPYEGMEFDYEQSACICCNSYARRIGFSTRVSVFQRACWDGSIICRQIVCSREGFRREGIWWDQ